MIKAVFGALLLFQDEALTPAPPSSRPPDRDDVIKHWVEKSSASCSAMSSYCTDATYATWFAWVCPVTCDSGYTFRDYSNNQDAILQTVDLLGGFGVNCSKAQDLGACTLLTISFTCPVSCVGQDRNDMIAAFLGNNISTCANPGISSPCASNAFVAWLCPITCRSGYTLYDYSNDQDSILSVQFGMNCSYAKESGACEQAAYRFTCPVSCFSQYDCPSVVTVSGAESVQPELMGKFAKAETTPTAANANRPIYVNANGMYLYYTALSKDWLISADYTTGIENASISSDRNNFATCPTLPSLATNWRARVNSSWIDVPTIVVFAYEVTTLEGDGPGDPTKCSTEKGRCCACDQSIGLYSCSWQEPATCHDGYIPKPVLGGSADRSSPHYDRYIELGCKYSCYPPQAPATCATAPFDCNGQAVKKANKGSDVTCSGNAQTCDASTCCEESCSSYMYTRVPRTWPRPIFAGGGIDRRWNYCHISFVKDCQSSWSSQACSSDADCFQKAESKCNSMSNCVSIGKDHYGYNLRDDSVPPQNDGDSWLKSCPSCVTTSEAACREAARINGYALGTSEYPFLSTEYSLESQYAPGCYLNNNLGALFYGFKGTHAERSGPVPQNLTRVIGVCSEGCDSSEVNGKKGCWYCFSSCPEIHMTSTKKWIEDTKEYLQNRVRANASWWPAGIQNLYNEWGCTKGRQSERDAWCGVATTVYWGGEAPATCATTPFDCSDQATDTVNKGNDVSCSGNASTCDASTCCEAPTTCATAQFDCSDQATNTVNKGNNVSCSGNASTCDASTCCEAPATCATTPYLCNGQDTKTVNKGSAVSCSGNATTCDASTCCEAPAACATPSFVFDCSAQATKTVNKGSSISCPGNATTCDASICCEAPTTCATAPYDCSGQSIFKVNRGSGVLCSGNASTCDASTCCEAPASCATAPFDCSAHATAKVNRGNAISCSGNASTCDASICCMAQATCASAPYNCSGQATDKVNKGSGVSCSGDARTCDAKTCCEAPATCATALFVFDCSGQATNTVNKGSTVSCHGNATTCDASTCCEAPATCTTAPFDCSGQSINTVNKGSSVFCPGAAATCDANTCCEAPASCATIPFDCSGQAPNMTNKGTGVMCSGNAQTCNASLCCEACADVSGEFFDEPTSYATVTFKQVGCTGSNPLMNNDGSIVTDMTTWTVQGNTVTFTNGEQLTATLDTTSRNDVDVLRFTNGATWERAKPMQLCVDSCVPKFADYGLDLCSYHACRGCSGCMATTNQMPISMVTILSDPVPAGSTTIAVVDITHIDIGDVFTLTHGVLSETKTVAAVTAGRARRLATAGVVTVVSAFVYAYPAGARVRVLQAYPTATPTAPLTASPTPAPLAPTKCQQCLNDGSDYCISSNQCTQRARMGACNGPTDHITGDAAFGAAGHPMQCPQTWHADQAPTPALPMPDPPTPAPKQAPTPAPPLPDPPKPAPTQADYIYGSLGSETCPSNYRLIETEAECKKAARYVMKLPYNGILVSSTKRLPYCWVGPGRKANFNPNADSGSDKDGSKLICTVQATQCNGTYGDMYDSASVVDCHQGQKWKCLNGQWLALGACEAAQCEGTYGDMYDSASVVDCHRGQKWKCSNGQWLDLGACEAGATRWRIRQTQQSSWTWNPTELSLFSNGACTSKLSTSGVQVSASGRVYGSYVPEHVIDQNTGSFWDGQCNANCLGEWIEIRFSAPVDVHCWELCQLNLDRAALAVTLEKFVSNTWIAVSTAVHLDSFCDATTCRCKTTPIDPTSTSPSPATPAPTDATPTISDSTKPPAESPSTNIIKEVCKATVSSMQYRSVYCSTDPGYDGIVSAVATSPQPDGFCTNDSADLTKYSRNARFCGGSSNTNLCKKFSWTVSGDGSWFWSFVGPKKPDFLRAIVFVDGLEIQRGDRHEVRNWTTSLGFGSHVIELYAFEDCCDGDYTGWLVSRTCEASKRHSKGGEMLNASKQHSKAGNVPNEQTEDGGASIMIAMFAALGAIAIVAVSCLAVCFVRMRRRTRLIKDPSKDTNNLCNAGPEISTNRELCTSVGNPSETDNPQPNRARRNSKTPHDICPRVESSAPPSREAPIKIIFSHSSRDKSPIATDIVESMISEFVALGVPRQQIMYQYSMDIPPNRHWADVWMAGLIESEVVIIIMEEAYLHSPACVAEFLCSQDKEQAIVSCSIDELQKCRSMDPRNGATGCGQIIMQLKTGKQLYIKGHKVAAQDIEKRFHAAFNEKGKPACSTGDTKVSTKVSL